MSDHAKFKLLEVYSFLKQQILNDPCFGCTDATRQALSHMLDYNVPQGKLLPTQRVVDCYKALKEGSKELTEDEFFLAVVLGWSIEWLQTSTLLVDDILDGSQTRHGQPCWFRLHKIGMGIAVNDVLFLRNHVYRILMKHFREKPYYVDLVELFAGVEPQSISGEMLDVITKGEAKKLSKFTSELYCRIAKYNGAYYSFELPVACALLLAGKNLKELSKIKDILFEIAVAYQIQDDYLDCFGDPETTGEIGTDIEEGKCTWLIVTALEHANEEQKQVLFENYGRADPICVERVKHIFKDLDLQGIYGEYEEKMYGKLKESVEAHPSKLVKAVWQRYATAYGSGIEY